MKKAERIFFYTTLLSLPLQLGKHFWPSFSFLYGLRIDYLSPTLYLTDISVFCLLFFWARSSKVTGKKILFFFNTHPFTGAYLLFLLFPVFFALQVPLAIYWYGKILEFFLFGLYIVMRRPQKKWILFCLAVGIVFESLLAFLQYHQQSSINGIFYFFGERTFTAETPGIANASIGGQLILRPYGTFPHPNVLAGFLLVSLLFVFFNIPLTISREIKKNGYLLVLLLGTGGLFLTLSRVALLFWIGTLSVFFLAKLVKKQFRFLFFGMIICLILCFLIFATPAASRFLSLSLTDESVTERATLFIVAKDMLFAHPFFGVGLNNFLLALPHLVTTTRIGLLQPVHNIYALVGAETGSIGLFFFLSMLFLVGKHLVIVQKSIPKEKKRSLTPLSVSLCFSAVLCLGMFDHYLLTLEQGQLLFAFVIGLSLATH